MQEDQDDSDPGLMLIIHYSLVGHSSGRTVEQQDQDLDIQHSEELDQVDVDFNSIDLTV